MQKNPLGVPVKTFTQLVDEAKRAAGNAEMTDNAISVRLGLNAISIHHMRHKAHVSDSLAMALGRFLGLSIGELVCAARAEREHDPELRMYLREWTERARVCIARQEAAERQPIAEAA